MASYIHGSAAPKPEQDWREEQLRRRRQQDIGKNVKKHHRIRRNQERAMYMDLPYVIILTLASICTLYLCVNYLTNPLTLEYNLSFRLEFKYIPAS